MGTLCTQPSASRQCGSAICPVIEFPPVASPGPDLSLYQELWPIFRSSHVVRVPYPVTINCEMMLRLSRYVMTLRYSLILTYLFCGRELLCLWENSKSTSTVLALSHVTKYHSDLFSYLLIEDYLVLLITFIYWCNSSPWYLFRCCTFPLCFIHRSGIYNHRTIFHWYRLFTESTIICPKWTPTLLCI